jgi:hypothetical protein
MSDNSKLIIIKGKKYFQIGFETVIPEEGKTYGIQMGEANRVVKLVEVEGGGGGATDYTALTNKPQINSIELTGNKSLDDLGIQAKGDYATTTALTEGLAGKADTSALPATTALMSGTAPTVADLAGTDVEGLKTELNAILAQLRTRGVIA